jgi:hypothetical protein
MSDLQQAFKAKGLGIQEIRQFSPRRQHFCLLIGFRAC